MAEPGTGWAREVENSGLVVAPGAASADAVKVLADSSELRKKFGAHARMRVVQRCDKATSSKHC